MSPTIVANASSARIGGGLSYIVRQLSALEAVRPDLELRVIGAPWNAEALRSSLRSPVEVLPVPRASARFAFEQLVLPWRLGSSDVLYCPGNFVPLSPRRARTVLTLQNCNYVGPGLTFAANQRWNRKAKIALSHRSLLAADRVVAISHALARDLLADLPEVAQRTVIIQSGAPTWPTEERPPPGFPLPAGHLLSLANDYAHKNLDLLTRAWVTAFSGPSDRVPALVFAGDITPARREAHLALVPVRLRPLVVHLGPIADRRVVRWLVNHAVAMAAPSALEAFPLTPAEAAALGCPTVLSDIPAHREVAGPNTRYVPSGDEMAFARALREVVDDPPPRTPWMWPRTWEDNASDLGAVFDEVADEVPSRGGGRR